MSAAVLASLFGAGLLVGLASGLIGIGGGTLIVPLLYFVYAHPAWSGFQVPFGLEAAVAHATSLFVILPTALLGTASFHRAGLVVWRAALPVGLAAILAAVAGARLALVLPAEALKLAFGIVLLVSAIQLLRSTGKPGAPPRVERLGARYTIPTGLAVGIFSALLGVGGGVVAIPLFIYLLGLDLRKVAATSLAVVAFASISGLVTYAVSGLAVPGLPPGSLGYVHVLAALPLMVGALLAVRLGVRANQRLRTRGLRLLFSAFFAILGIRLIIENAPGLF